MTMSVALTQNDHIVNVKDTERGLACNCFCFECGEPVIARKGDKNEHHFAHVNNKESCTITPESVLHKYAKQVILEQKYIKLPKTETQEERIWHFDKLIPEQTIGKIRPDLVASIDKGVMIFIEIAVTSFVDEEKLAYIQHLDVPVIELDLSQFHKRNFDIPSNEARDYILLNCYNKKWLHPRINTTDYKKETTVNHEAEKNKTFSIEDTKKLFLEQIEDEDITAQRVFRSPQKGYTKYSFTIQQMWVDALMFDSGMLSVRCVTFNPNMVEILKGWKREGRGYYNKKHTSWNFNKPFSDVVLQRLQNMNETPKV